MDYEYDGDHYQISYEDSFGKIRVLLIWVGSLRYH